MIDNSEIEPIGENEHAEAQAENPQERQSVEQHLFEVEDMLKKMEQSGISDSQQIDQEHIILEQEYKDTLLDLRTKIGDINISEESEGMIHKHIVDEVIGFKEKVLIKYKNLLKLRDGLSVEEIAKRSSTVGDFETKLRTQNTTNTNPSTVEASRNLTAITEGHKDYKVTVGLSDTGAAGITHMGPNGGEAVEIDADHLATVTTEEGSKEVDQTFDHEQTHLNQTRLPTGDGETVIIDPINNKEITEAIIHEGGAVNVTKKMDGRDETLADDQVYKKGDQFYQRNDADTVNSHVNKDGDNPGDRVHLQFQLAKDAEITEPEKLLDMAEKTSFTEKEIQQLLELIQKSGTIASNTDDVALAA